PVSQADITGQAAVTASADFAALAASLGVTANDPERAEKLGSLAAIVSHEYNQGGRYQIVGNTLARQLPQGVNTVQEYVTFLKNNPATLTQAEIDAVQNSPDFAALATKLGADTGNAAEQAEKKG